MSNWYDKFPNGVFFGGSHTLWHFLKSIGKKQSWTPHDIDIFTDIKPGINDNGTIVNEEIVTKQVNEWKIILSDMKLQKLQYNEFYDWYKFGNGINPKFSPRQNDKEDSGEDFDNAIVAVATFTKEKEIDQKNEKAKNNVQIVLLDKRVYDSPSLEHLLMKIIDIKVLFTYDSKIKKKSYLFEPDFAKQLNFNTIFSMCPKRKAKYTERGFNCP